MPSLPSVLVVGDVFHPVDVLAADHVADRDVAHAVARGRSVPMLHAGRGLDNVPWLDLSLLAAFFLHPSGPGCDDQVLAGRMGMPCRP